MVAFSIWCVNSTVSVPHRHWSPWIMCCKECNLTLADVAAYVHTNPRSYHRAPVVLREAYDLLVMTWLPGQASVPHDHGGSICVMKVMQGEAVEGCLSRGGGRLRRSAI